MIGFCRLAGAIITVWRRRYPVGATARTGSGTASMSTLNAYIAATRFGLGPQPGELARIGGDPRAWLKAQIQPETSPAAFSRLPASTDIVLQIAHARRAGSKAYQTAIEELSRALAPAEFAARMTLATTSEAPFRERLMQFWCNHFTVSGVTPKVLPVVGAYEREVIRPRIFGRFEDLLFAAVRHPAMLMYLRNVYSFGPRSTLGKLIKDFNERFAHAILAYHTLGPRGPYGQDDVRALASMLTGWTHGGIGGRGPHDGRFRFRPDGHEPGDKRFLGRRYAEAGVEEAERAISFLAGHGATARFIATKLARHFVADEPPPEVVYALSQVFAESGGDLAQVSTALVDLDAAWAAPLSKVKSPYDLVISTLRAISDQEGKPTALMRALREMGQQVYQAPTPAGWPDRGEAWLAGDALLSRIQWAREVASFMPRHVDPMALADVAIGPVAAPGALDVIAQAPSLETGVALVFASAEFQRR